MLSGEPSSTQGSAELPNDFFEGPLVREMRSEDKKRKATEIHRDEGAYDLDGKSKGTGLEATTSEKSTPEKSNIGKRRIATPKKKVSFIADQAREEEIAERIAALERLARDEVDSEEEDTTPTKRRRYALDESNEGEIIQGDSGPKQGSLRRARSFSDYERGRARVRTSLPARHKQQEKATYEGDADMGGVE